MASQNSPSECFQAICHNGDFKKKKKKVFNVLSCVATQTIKPFLGYVLLSQMFLRVKQKPKCKAIDVTKQEAIMEQGNQVGISLLKLFLDSVLLGEKKKEILSLYCGQKTFVFMYLNIQYW